MALWLPHCDWPSHHRLWRLWSCVSIKCMSQMSQIFQAAFAWLSDPLSWLIYHAQTPLGAKERLLPESKLKSKKNSVLFCAPHRLLPGRYVQWSCTTPTMLFTLSKISDFTPRQTWVTMFFDWLMIITGFIAAVLPPGIFSCEWDLLIS
jgi:hypothetical protein